MLRNPAHPVEQKIADVTPLPPVLVSLVREYISPSEQMVQAVNISLSNLLQASGFLPMRILRARFFRILF
jgi:hypothetical protein